MPAPASPPFAIAQHAVELDAEELRALRDPVALLADPRTRLLKRGLAGRMVGHVRQGARQCIVKIFDESALRHRLQRLFTGPAAARSSAGAVLMRAAGLRAPQTLAVLKTSYWKVRIASCLVMEYIEGRRGDLLWEELRGRARSRFAVVLADHMRRIHGAGLYPQDVGMWNWIAPPDAFHQLVLVDLDRVRRYGRLSWRRRAKNLVQLERSFGRSAQPAEKLVFLRRYLGLRAGSELTAVAARVSRAALEKDRCEERRRARRKDCAGDLV